MPPSGGARTCPTAWSFGRRCIESKRPPLHVASRCSSGQLPEHRKSTCNNSSQMTMLQMWLLLRCLRAAAENMWSVDGLTSILKILSPNETIFRDPGRRLAIPWSRDVLSRNHPGCQTISSTAEPLVVCPVHCWVSNLRS